jgi:hypothetical protein
MDPTFLTHIMYREKKKITLTDLFAQRYSAGLRAEWSGGRLVVETGNFSLHHRVQTGSGAHPDSYPIGTRGSFPGGKAVWSWSWPLTSISAEVKNEWSYTSTPPIRLHGVMFSLKSTEITLPFTFIDILQDMVVIEWGSYPFCVNVGSCLANLLVICLWSPYKATRRPKATNLNSISRP